MNLPFLFARRYIFGKKSTNAINIITGITIGGLALGTAALVIIMSIFNGFGDLVGNLFNSFNPDIKISAKQGKGFVSDDNLVLQIRELDGVISVSQTLEEKALLEYRDLQDVGTIKGVDEEFRQVTTIDSTIREGYIDFNPDGPPRAIVGAGLRRRMGINVADFFTQLRIFMPRKASRLSMDKPFRSKSVQPSGVFSFQQEYDFQYIITPLSFLQSLTGRKDIGAIEIKLRDLEDLNRIKTELQALLPEELRLEDRYEQDAEFLRLMKIEKWMGFAITSLTLVILSFTIVGALWMIVLDKRLDIGILKSMGSTRSDIFRLFFTTGLMMTMIGLVIGLIISVIFYILQKQFGLIGIPEGFIVSAYPIEMYLLDVLAVIAIVSIIGALASLLPARKAALMQDILRVDG